MRDTDGLAMSSRNAYLSADERRRALVLFRTLQDVEKAFRAGERNARTIAECGRNVIAQEPDVRLDYFEIVDPEMLDPVERITGKVVGCDRRLCGVDAPDRQRASCGLSKERSFFCEAILENEDCVEFRSVFRPKQTNFPQSHSATATRPTS